MPTSPPPEPAPASTPGASPSRTIPYVLAIASVVAVALITVLIAGSDSAGAARWQPQPSTSAWQWQLQGKINTSVDAHVYEVDGFDTPKKTVGTLHKMHRKVICYLDVGSWESYRPDARAFPASVKGKRYEGYPNERWLDIRKIKALAPILRKRFNMCKKKKFDAVEPDNIAGFENRTGFPLTGTDQLRFNRWVAKEVHKRGMSVALKNDGSQVEDLVGQFDFAVVEECFKYKECGDYYPFIKARKAVFEAEYQLPPKKFCPHAKELRYSAIRKSFDLTAKPWLPCD